MPAAAARSAPRPRATSSRRRTIACEPSLRSRAERLVSREIPFIHNAEFARRGAERRILAEADAVPAKRRLRSVPRNVPAYFASLYETPLLRPHEEADLFRRMNFLRYRANALRSSIDPQRPDVALLDQVERLLGQAQDVRDRIVRANLRLVVSLARKYADSPDRFDEYVSDGNLTLLNAVDKFDYARGFRFSTYATHAVRRSYFRLQKRRWAEAARTWRSGPDALLELPDRQPADSEDERQWALYRRLLESMRTELDDRERAILQARFGIGAADGGCTLSQVAATLDICKERVRQLQIRAIAKLQAALGDVDLDAVAAPATDPTHAADGTSR